MAFIIQYLQLRQHVRQQLQEVVPVGEKEQEAPTPNPADDTADDNRSANSEVTVVVPNPSKMCNTSSPPFCQIPGIMLEVDCNGEQYYRVGWAGPDDPFNPQRWSKTRRLFATFSVCFIALVTTMASAIDSAVITEASRAFGVSDVAESLATGIYLIGFGVGALVASPLSEMVGRYPVYLGALVIFGAWILGAALAPNIGAQLAFRFLAGLFGSAPLTVAGGSIGDLWTTLEKTFGFPAFAIPAFGGPVLGMFV